MPILDVARKGADLLRPLAALATRVVLGQLFLVAGLGKLKNLEGAAEGFKQLGLVWPTPYVFASFIGISETVGGALVLLGLWTRLGALLLTGVMVGALLTAHKDQVIAALTLIPEKGQALTDLTAAMAFLLLFWLLAFGAGPISADWFVARQRTAKPTPPLS